MDRILHRETPRPRRRRAAPAARGTAGNARLRAGRRGRACGRGRVEASATGRVVPWRRGAMVFSSRPSDLPLLERVIKIRSRGPSRALPPPSTQYRLKPTSPRSATAVSTSRGHRADATWTRDSTASRLHDRPPRIRHTNASRIPHTLTYVIVPRPLKLLL